MAANRHKQTAEHFTDKAEKEKEQKPPPAAKYWSRTWPLHSARADEKDEAVRKAKPRDDMRHTATSRHAQAPQWQLKFPLQWMMVNASTRNWASRVVDELV